MSGDSRELPRVADDARFVSEHEAVGRPHIVVDGPTLPGTVLCLSHWPATAPPTETLGDTSADMVDRYLDLDASGDEIALITNNHFDEDGLFAAWLLLESPPPGPLRSRALAAAEAGDFHTWTEPEAVACALTAMAMVERETTPFSAVKRALADPVNDELTAILYRTVLARTASLLADPERYGFLWHEPWQRIEADIASLDTGESTIEEHPELDLAVVTGPRLLSRYAVYPRTRCMRVLARDADGLAVLRYRYETWIRYVSRELSPRVDLAPAAADLQPLDDDDGSWVFEGVAAATPRLYRCDPRGRPVPSAIATDRLVASLGPHLEHSP